MKKIVTLLLVLAVLLSFGVFALGSGSDGEDSDQGSGSADKQNTDSAKLGDYKVEIKNCRLAEDYEGKPVVIVTYGFTNVSDDESAAFMFTIDATVYQDGVGLNEAYILDDSANYSSDNQSKEIKSGASLDVEVAYELNDTTTDIDVEVQELISLSEKKLTKTFSIT